jgi:hypothetical protein
MKKYGKGPIPKSELQPEEGTPNECRENRSVLGLPHEQLRPNQATLDQCPTGLRRGHLHD